MKRYIFLSLLSVAAATALILPISISPGSNVSVLRICLGGAFIALPQAIWLWAGNDVASKTLKKAPSNLVRALAVFFVFAIALGYGSILSASPSSNETLILIFATVLYPAGFVALFASIIMVSRRIIDAEDDPHVARGSRIFVLCLGFFYVIIGMFFIGPRLKRLRAKASA